MSKRVYNFGAGPAMLPDAVMRQAQEEFLDFKGLGVSVIEISHRTSHFEDLLNECTTLFQELLNLPKNYKVLYCHGGGQMQFSMVPMNLIHRNPSKKAQYIETGNFATRARKEAGKFGNIEVVATGEANSFSEIPTVTKDMIDPNASYVHLTSNNTLYGTRFNEFPDTGDVPIVADMTSEIGSRVMDFNQFGAVFAGTQKNLGPSGMAVVIIREDLIGLRQDDCPKLLDYKDYYDNNSLSNTINTFAIYMMNLVLKWQRSQGGVAAFEALNAKKSSLVYNQIDSSDFYSGQAHPDHRSHMNACFNLPSEELLQKFLKESGEADLFALKGHRAVGGARASIYNPMPLAGVEALVDFMKDFEKRNG